MSKPLGLFKGFGIELEYMIVRSDTLDVYPVADELLRQVSGSYESEVEFGDMAWNNELALHVIEIKTNGPVPDLDGLDVKFHSQVNRLNTILEAYGARLMPGAMHPWMDPCSQMKLWPHEYNPIYEAYNRIFDCRGHGWANLQSTHINLPFSGNEEFGRLHAAIRMLMPVMPALTASSPVMDNKINGTFDNRLTVYRTNSRRIPSVTGLVVPEAVYTREEYENELLGNIYKDIRPYDPEGILQYEWLNSRGAIARFDRMAIEIRILDIQECPVADLATSALITGALKALTREKWSGQNEQKKWPADRLNNILTSVTEKGGDFILSDPEYLEMFGINTGSLTATEFWTCLLNDIYIADDKYRKALSVILNEGCLSKRLIKAIGPGTDSGRIKDVYEELCSCLNHGIMFLP
ncbi:MAG: carboxylate-amine ligase [Cyclonatronaceae bacterium]